MKNQEIRYTEYCKSKGYKLIDTYADEGLTGTNVRRIEFKRMLYDAGLDYVRSDLGYDTFTPSKNRKPLFDIIICKDVSRFSRGSVQGQMIVKHLKDKGVNTVFENSGMSTFDEGWEFNIGILFQIAQSESSNMGKRIKFTKQLNARNGKYSPARLPYGYIRNKQKEILIDQEQAEVVNFIFNRYLEVGGSTIAKELNEKGIKTQTGKLWTEDKVTRAIQQTIYIGEAVVGKTTKENVTDTRRKKLDEKEHIIISNAVEPIISRELFEKAQLVKESRVNKNKKVGRKPARKDKYFGKIYCSNCGSRFVRHIGNGDKINYICQNRRKNLGCRVRGISINNIDKHLGEVEVNHLANSMGDSIYYKELLNQLDIQRKQLDNIKKQVGDQIESLEEEIETISDQFAFAKDSEKMKARLVKKVEDRENQITELKQQLDNLNIEAIDRIQSKVMEKKEIIDEIGTNRLVTPEEKLQLLKVVSVGDYEINFNFSLPNFEEEVDLFNKLFPMSPISLEIPFNPFNNYFKRNHKEAREYWESVNEE